MNQSRTTPGRLLVGLSLLLASASAGCGGTEELTTRSFTWTTVEQRLVGWDPDRTAFLALDPDGTSVVRHRETGQVLHQRRTPDGWRYLRFRDGDYDAVDYDGRHVRTRRIPSPVNIELSVGGAGSLLAWDPDGPHPDPTAAVLTGRAYWQPDHERPLVRLDLEGPPHAATVTTAPDGRTPVLAVFGPRGLHLRIDPFGSPVTWRVPLAPEGASAPAITALFALEDRLIFHLADARDLFVVRLPETGQAPVVNLISLPGVPHAAFPDPQRRSIELLVPDGTGTLRVRFDPRTEQTAIRRFDAELRPVRRTSTQTGDLYWRPDGEVAVWEADEGAIVRQVRVDGNLEAALGTSGGDTVVLLSRKNDRASALLYDAAEDTRVPVSFPPAEIRSRRAVRIDATVLIPYASSPAWIRIDPERAEVSVVDHTEAFDRADRDFIHNPRRFLALDNGYMALFDAEEIGGAGIWIREGRRAAVLSRLALRGLLDAEQRMP